jgi:hypothetical protein
MHGAIPPLSQYVFMVWHSVKAQEQLYLTIRTSNIFIHKQRDIFTFYLIACMEEINSEVLVGRQE